jgi:hypothetical protein
MEGAKAEVLARGGPHLDIARVCLVPINQDVLAVEEVAWKGTFWSVKTVSLFS